MELDGWERKLFGNRGVFDLGGVIEAEAFDDFGHV
jgi:hypothetical protein